MKATLRSAQGQATVEWVGLVLLAALALGALVAVAPPVDGRAFGGFLAHCIVCSAAGGCDDEDAALRAYGERDAELVRRYAPNLVYEPGERQLPVDYRGCRTRGCADAVDDRDADLHRSLAGRRASVFTHVVRRGGHPVLALSRVHVRRSRQAAPAATLPARPAASVVPSRTRSRVLIAHRRGGRRRTAVASVRQPVIKNSA